MKLAAACSRLTLALVSAAFAASVPAADRPVFHTPGLLTSIGQSSDIAVVKVLLNTKLKLGLEVKPLARPEDLDGARSLVVVVGASTKGLGAAGLDMGQEIERAKALLDAARERGIPILALHTGGESRRGKTTNDLIDLVVPRADRVVVVRSGNRDGLFQKLADPLSIPVVEVDSLAAAGDAVKTVYAQ